MDALGLLCLIFFLIGAFVLFYYLYICRGVRTSWTHSILESDEKIVLKFPNDLNGNDSVSIPIGDLDQPDLHPATAQNESFSSTDSSSESDTSDPTNPSAPTDGSHEREESPLFVVDVQLERIVSSEDHVFLNVEEDLRPLSNSDEEDGLIYINESGITAASVIKLPGSLEKHVHFPYIDHTDEDTADGSSCDVPHIDHKNVSVSKLQKPNNKSRPILKSEPKDGYYNPIDNIKVQLVLPNSTESSCEELYIHSSGDSDTSEPDVTEYSFMIGPKVPSTSVVLANEISSSTEPKIIKIAPLADISVNNIEVDKNSLSSNDDLTLIPTDEHLDTPPNTPPDCDPKDLKTANIFEKSTISSAFTVNKRNHSVSSTSSLSADDIDEIMITTALVKK